MKAFQSLLFCDSYRLGVAGESLPGDLDDPSTGSFPLSLDMISLSLSQNHLERETLMKD